MDATFSEYTLSIVYSDGDRDTHVAQGFAGGEYFARVAARALAAVDGVREVYVTEVRFAAVNDDHPERFVTYSTLYS